VFADLLERVALALDGERLPYMVIGGQAVLLHGEPRLTKDVDITVAAGLEELDSVVRAAKNAGLDPLVEPDDFTRRTMVLPCRDPETSVRVDFVLSHSLYEREAIDRSVTVRLGEAAVHFATAEDLVVHKVLAGRPRDLEDVRAIVLKQPDLDRSLIHGTLQQFQEALNRGEELTDCFAAVCRDVD
jgi:hypothetical protein